MRSTEKTINAGRDQDIWEKRADAYVDTIAALLQRSTASEGELIPFYIDDAGNIVKSEVPSYQAKDRFDLEARLVAYCSPAVRRAYEAMKTAEQEVSTLRREWADLRSRQQQIEENDPGDALARNAIASALADINMRTRPTLARAREMGSKLIDQMRVELHSEPSPAHTGKAWPGLMGGPDPV